MTEQLVMETPEEGAEQYEKELAEFASREGSEQLIEALAAECLKAVPEGPDYRPDDSVLAMLLLDDRGQEKRIRVLRMEVIPIEDTDRRFVFEAACRRLTERLPDGCFVGVADFALCDAVEPETGLSLYWCTTEDWSQCWFVVAESEEEAAEVFEDGSCAVEAQWVCAVPEQATDLVDEQPARASDELIKACGGTLGCLYKDQFIPTGDDGTRMPGRRAVQIADAVYAEGDLSVDEAKESN